MCQCMETPNCKICMLWKQESRFLLSPQSAICRNQAFLKLSDQFIRQNSPNFVTNSRPDAQCGYAPFQFVYQPRPPLSPIRAHQQTLVRRPLLVSCSQTLPFPAIVWESGYARLALCIVDSEQALLSMFVWRLSEWVCFILSCVFFCRL